MISKFHDTKPPITTNFTTTENLNTSLLVRETIRQKKSFNLGSTISRSIKIHDEYYTDIYQNHKHRTRNEIETDKRDGASLKRSFFITFSCKLENIKNPPNINKKKNHTNTTGKCCFFKCTFVYICTTFPSANYSTAVYQIF